MLGTDIEPTLCGDFECRTGWVGAPIRGAARTYQKLAAYHRHTLRAVRIEVEFPGINDADCVLPAMALEPDALDLTFEIVVVLEHAFFLLQRAAAANDPFASKVDGSDP